MEKPKLLYASPFWPMKSGISEYSENLLSGLEHFFDITLLTDQYTLQNRTLIRKFPVIRYQKGKRYENYDYVLYNLGNNPDYHSYMVDAMIDNPGYIILHDYSLYYLAINYYREKGCLFQKLYEIHGVEGVMLVKDSLKNNIQKDLLQYKDLASKVPFNKEFIKVSKGIFVHSSYTKNKLKEECGIITAQEIPFCQPLLIPVNSEDKSFLVKKFKDISSSDYVIASVGFIAPSKQNELICKAVLEYNRLHEEKIHYVMIGDGDYVDAYLDTYIHKTGFLEIEDFYKAIEACDLIFNLRNPYGGETSAPLLQCMVKGLPCVVTDIGWFSELPNDCVIKIDENVNALSIVNIIEDCINSDLSLLKNNAVNHITKNCNPDNVAKKISEAIKGMNRKET